LEEDDGCLEEEDDECLEDGLLMDNKVSVVIEFNDGIGVKLNDLNMSDITNVIRIKCDIDADELITGTESDKDGNVRLIVYLDNEEIATSIVKTIKDMQGPTCDNGVLCSVKKVHIVKEEGEWDVAGTFSMHSVMNHVLVMMMTVSLFLTLFSVV